MSEYHYKPLQKGEIRLLKLDALSNPAHSLSGTIIHHKLTTPTYRRPQDGSPSYLEYPLPYDALSYHWGSDNKTPCSILIHDDGQDDAVIKVTKTLHRILRKLALPDQPRVLWADAICINQINSSTNTEKGEQIQLMPDIYRTAACVQVYLGDESDNLPAALELLSSIADYSEHLDDTGHEEGEIGLDLAARGGFMLPPPEDKRWPALRAFFRRPWFRRVWVIQEFVYATDVRVLCGDLEIDWHRLWLASKAYGTNRNLIFQGYRWNPLRLVMEYNAHREAHEGALSLHLITDLRLRAMGYMSGPYMVYNMDRGEPSNITGLSIRKNLDAIKGFENWARNGLLMDRAEGKTFPYGRSSLLELLHRTSNFRASKKVDRMYALLGLAEDAGGYQPIYSEVETAVVVSTKLAAMFISNGHLQQILASAGIVSNRYSSRERPSWVPDWTNVCFAQDRHIGFTLISTIQTGLEEKDRKREERARQTSEENEPSVPPAEFDASKLEGDHPPPQQDASAPGNVTTEEKEKKQENTAKIYNASGDLPMVFRGDAFKGELTVRATSIGRVLGVFPGRLLLPGFLYEGMVSKLGDIYPTGETMKEALWRTLIANRTMLSGPAPPEFEKQYDNMKVHDNMLIFKAVILVALASIVAFPFFVFAIRSLPVLLHVGVLTGLWWLECMHVAPAVGYIVLLPVFRWLYLWVLVPLLVAMMWYLSLKVYPLASLEVLSRMGCSTAVQTASMPKDCAQYAIAMADTVNRHVLGVTQERLMGLMPLLTQEGDIVVLIHGCDVPYLVRPTKVQGLYRLVGEAYVHGVMNGERAENAAENYVDIVLI